MPNQEMLELADLIERSQGLICTVRNGRIVHLKASQISFIITALRQAAASNQTKED